jgi:competence protein ComEC
MERPLIPILTSFVAGITIGNYYQFPDLPLLTALLVTLMLMLLASLKKSTRVIAVLLVLSSVIIGILDINLYLYKDPGSQHIINYIGKEKLIVEGIISENPEVSTDRTELTVSTVRLIHDDDAIIPIEGFVLLSVNGNQEFKYGDFIRFKTRLKAPHSFRNPGGFDYVKHLRYRGIMARGFIRDSSGLVVLRENQGDIFKIYLERMRRNLKRLIRDNSSSPEGEIIQAMILGDQKEIPKEVMDKFNKTGTTHIIAISGFNIGIVAFLSFIVIRLIMKSSAYLLLRFNIFKFSTICAIIPVIIYTFIAGMGVSVVRAAIMAVTFMIAIILGKERDLYNSLALAALMILVVYPPSLFDVSFQLSFVAVWAILFIAPRLTLMIPEGKPEAESRHKAMTKKVFKNVYIFLVVSLSATLGTLPLIVFYFNRMSTVVLLSNLIVVPILGIIAIPVCTAIILVAPLSNALAILFLDISSFLVRISVSMVDLFASIPGSSVFITTPTVLEITAYYLFLIATVKLIDFIKRDESNAFNIKSTISLLLYRVILAVLAVFFIIDATYIHIKDNSENLKITYIDVGQGSSTLIRLPGGKKVLVDGGGSYENIFDVGKYVVAPYLWHERIKDIDIVVLTHPHPDHLNGLLHILSNFDVKEVWSNGESAEIETYEDFVKIINEKNITHRLISEDTGNITINGATITILNPPKSIDSRNDLSRKFDETNNDAIVMKLTVGNVSILLPSDISEPTETSLVKSGKNLKSQIILVPHHGGLTSSTIPFLNSVKPEIAVISCGADNVYNDPRPDVLKRYLQLGTKILRTDINGAVDVTTDGKNIAYSSYK